MSFSCHLFGQLCCRNSESNSETFGFCALVPSAGCLCSLQSVEAALQAEQDPEAHWSWQSWPSLEPTSHSALMVAALSWSRFSSSPEKNKTKQKQRDVIYTDYVYKHTNIVVTVWSGPDLFTWRLAIPWSYSGILDNSHSARYLAKVRMHVYKKSLKGLELLV